MVTTKHQQLNSLVKQVQEDAAYLNNLAGRALYFDIDQFKFLRDTATAILHKLDRYEELLK